MRTATRPDTIEAAKIWLERAPIEARTEMARIRLYELRARISLTWAEELRLVALSLYESATDWATL